MPVKVADKPEIKESITKTEEKPLETLSMEDIISKTVSETLKAIVPLLQRNNQPAEPSLQTSDAVRAKVIKNINAEFDNVVRKNSEFMSKLASSPKSDFVYITIPQIYKPYFGSMLPVGLNGSIINIPIDNRPHLVHKAYVPIIRQKLNYEDEKIDFMNRSGGSDIFQVSSRDDLGN